VQVLQELYVNVVRPPRCAMTHADAVAAIPQLLRRPTVATDAALVLEGLRLKARYQISYSDAAIVAAARGLGARVLYSEDLKHSQDYDGSGCIESVFFANHKPMRGREVAPVGWAPRVDPYTLGLRPPDGQRAEWPRC